MINKAHIEGMIDKKTNECLTPDLPKVACLYLLPKLHKNLQTPPGRPIISGNESLCENISPTKDGIPTGQFMRARRICSREDLFQNQANNLKERFLERGYKPHTIQKGYEKALTKKRDALLTDTFGPFF